MFSDSLQIYPIMLFGKTGVGKNSIIDYYKQNLEKNPKNLTNDNSDFRLFNFEGGKANLYFLSGSGSDEIFTKNLFQRYDNIIFVIDITDEDSFEKVKGWIQELKIDQANFPKKCLTIFANKFDSLKYKKLFEEINKYAEENEIKCFTTSAKTKYQLMDGLSYIVNLAFDKSQSNKGKPNNEKSQDIGETGESEQSQKRRKSEEIEESKVRGKNQENVETKKPNIFKRIFCYCCYP